MGVVGAAAMGDFDFFNIDISLPADNSNYFVFTTKKVPVAPPKPVIKLRVTCRCRNTYESESEAGPFECPQCSWEKQGYKTFIHYRLQDVGVQVFDEFSASPGYILDRLAACKKNWPKHSFQVLAYPAEVLKDGARRPKNVTYRVATLEEIEAHARRIGELSTFSIKIGATTAYSFVGSTSTNG